jgi:thiol-disulfide isomerase/thioredoxin
MLAAGACLCASLLANGSPATARLAAAPDVAACPANAKKANFNFTLKDLNGRTVKLSDYQGKVLLLDFWATWCAPCKVEIPAFIDLYKTYKPRGFEVVGVVVMEDFVKAKPYVQQNGINYTVLDGVDREDVEDAYGPLFALPTSLVIARDGRICARHVGLPPTRTKDPSVNDVKEFFAATIKALL